jgi:diguanylate cyclase (GGDEF)-like protein
MKLTVQDVEAYADGRMRELAFPPALEHRFEQDMAARRCARLKTGLLVSVLLYNLFLISDWLLTPDVFHIAVWLHLGVVTPWMLFAAWLMTRQPNPVVRECVAASVPLLIMFQIDLGFIRTESEYAAHYQYVVLPMLLYTNVSIHRLAFRYARVVTAVVVTCHATAILTASYLTNQVATMVVVQLLAVAYITLVANFTMERDLRRSYVYALRDRLRSSQAEAASQRDALTSAGNRRLLDLQMQQLWNRGKAAATTVAIVMVDIDHFKNLNDRYGHVAGDLCLKRVVTILDAEAQQHSGTVIRYGGEEFLVLLPQLALVDAMRIAERIRRAVERAAIPNKDNAANGCITVSLGVAAASTADLSASELIALADNALYVAKRRGRNQVWPPIAAVVEEQAESLPKAFIA